VNLEREIASWATRLKRLRHSVRGKVMAVVLTTTTVSVLVAGAAMLFYDVTVYRHSWVTDLSTQAQILARSTAPALLFDDLTTAQRNLASLQARPEVLEVALYDAQGVLYTSYVRPGTAPPPTSLHDPHLGTQVSGEHVQLIQPVLQIKGERIGTLYLSARYDVQSRIDAYLSIFGLVIILCALLSLVLSSLLQRLITAPLEAIAHTARKVVEQGDYTPRARPSKDPQIGLVVEAFNRMLDEVQQRTQAQQQTEEALRQADRRKDEFLATLAHELRNPLSPIRHAVKLLELPAADERQKQWGRDVISRQVQRMALLLDDLLDVSRITRGRLTLKISSVELSNVVAAAVETARPLMEAKHQSLTTVLPPQPITLNVDSLRISQALSNLLTNAAKYTDVDGRVVLTTAADTTGLMLSVEDSGIGLSPQIIPKLFEMFSQVQSAVDRTEGGLGIGLALVKGLVELHGGTVEAQSAGLGLGSRFIIRLPVTCLASQPGAAKSTLSPPPRIQAGPRCRIVLADDNHDAVESLAAVLQMSGYEAYVTHSAAEALEAGARVHPHAFILDIGMPGVSGYELARRIRLETWGKDALLIAVTGWGQQQDKERSRNAGFDHHLTKPVPVDELERLLLEFDQTRNRTVQNNV
jgi:signal transduction histidine kinase/ActR/RegA family two-component response regulator